MKTIKILRNEIWTYNYPIIMDKFYPVVFWRITDTLATTELDAYVYNINSIIAKRLKHENN